MNASEIEEAVSTTKTEYHSMEATPQIVRG